MITQERLKQLLNYNPTTGDFSWISTAGGRRKGSVAGYVTVRGYRVIVIDRKVHYAHRLVWLYMHGYFPERGVDHVDRDRSNNRLDNLREVNQVCNTRNTGNWVTNSSGVKGVYFHKRAGKWNARIKVNYKYIHLGLHQDFDEAVCHRLAAEQSLGWAGCDAASPAFKYVRKMVSV